MASETITRTRGWIKHDGGGRPVPRGSHIDIRHFNGDVSRNVLIGGDAVAFLPDGTRSSGPSFYSGWRFDDGGPMGPKFREYRIVESEARTQSGMTVLRSLLGSPVREIA